MASVWIDAIWRGQSVTAGIAKTKQELGGLQSQASKLWSEVGGVQGLLGLGGVVAAVQAVRLSIAAGVTGVLDWEAAAQRTTGTLENLGRGGTAAFGQVEAAVNRVVAKTRFGDDQLLDAANSLIEGTQDVEASLQNLSVVADLAAAKQIDLASASAIVAKVMEGNNRAVAQMLPFLRTYAESIDGIADPAEKAALMMRKLMETVGGKAADELKTGRGAWLDYKDAFGEAMEALAVKSGLLPAVTAQVRELTRELNAMQNPGDADSMSSFDKKVIDAVIAAFPALQRINRENNRIQSGHAAPGAGFGDLRTMENADGFDRARVSPALGPELGPGNSEGIATAIWNILSSKWSIENGISDDRQTMRRPGRRGRDDLGRDLAGGRKVEPLDDSAFDAMQERTEQVGAYLQSTISGAIVAGGNSGWDGFLSSLKQTGLSALADLLGGVLANIFAPGSGVAGGILGPLFGLGGGGGVGVGASMERNLTMRRMRLS